MARGSGITICFVLVAAAVTALAQLSPLIAVGLSVAIAVLAIAGWHRTGVLVIVLGMATAPLNRLGFGGAEASVAASDLLLLLGFAMLAPEMMRAHRLRLPPMFLVAAIGLLITGGVASLASGEPLLSLINLARLLIAAVVLPVLFLWWAPSLRMIGLLAGAFIAGNLFNIAYTYVDSNPYQRVRAFGLTTHFNNYALTCLLALALVAFALKTLPKQWGPVIYLAGGLSAFGIWTSGSRAALLVVILAGGLFLVVERWGRLAWLAALGSCVVALTWSSIATTDSQSALSRLLGGAQSANSNRERSEALSAGWSVFWDHPLLGNGFVHVIDYHNVYLAVSVAAGVFGLAFFLLLLMSAISLIATTSRPAALLAYPVLAYAMFAGLSTNLWDRFVWVVFALALCAQQATREERDIESADVENDNVARPHQAKARRIGWSS